MAHLLVNFGADNFGTFDGSRGDIVELIEIRGPEDASRTTVTANLVDNYITRDFPCTATPSRKETLKFFLSIRQGDYNGDMVPIPMPQLLYNKIAPFARIPFIYPGVLFRKTAVAVFATPQTPQTNDLTKPSISQGAVGREYLSFIIQSVPGAESGVCAGTSFTYHLPTRHMYVFMHCLEHPSCTFFSQIIEKSPLVRTSSFLIPSLLIQYNLEERLVSLNSLHSVVYHFENLLGIRVDRLNIVDLKEVNFAAITSGVNSVMAHLAYSTWACDNTNKQLAFLDEVGRRYAELALENGFEKEEFEKVRDLLLDTHAFLRSWNNGLKERTEYISKRTQALVQTVYSGIAQRDAALSHSAAVASAQDSAVMRVIAAITILFLPATTTATFFSTAFFNFNVGPYERVYSWWLWLYWVVTISLTAVVLVGAILWWQRKEAEIASRVGRAKAQGPGSKGHRQ